MWLFGVSLEIFGFSVVIILVFFRLRLDGSGIGIVFECWLRFSGLMLMVVCFS